MNNAEKISLLQEQIKNDKFLLERCKTALNTYRLGGDIGSRTASELNFDLEVAIQRIIN